MGKEFVNLVTTIITFRLLKAVSKTNLLDKMSFGDLIDDLGTAWGLTDSFNSEKPQSSDDKWVHTLDCVIDELEKLDLSIPTPKPAPKKEVENLNQKRTNRKDLKVVLRRSYLHLSTAICESFNKFIFENRILIAGYALQSL